MHPKRRFLFRAVIALVLSFTGLIHAQVNTTGKVTALEQFEKVAVLSDEHPAVREYYETRAMELQETIIDLPPVRFAREPWEPPSIAFERSAVRKPAVRYPAPGNRRRMRKRVAGVL